MANGRARKRSEHRRRAYFADLKHLQRCCNAGLLPKNNCEYLDEILSSNKKLPKPKEVAERVQLRNEQRELHKLWSIPPIDLTPAELVEQRKKKDRERKMAKRRMLGMRTRAKGEQPWTALGISESTWYRRKAKGETPMSGELAATRDSPMSGQLNGSDSPMSEGISFNSTDTPLSRPAKRTVRKRAFKEKVDAYPDVDFHGQPVK